MGMLFTGYGGYFKSTGTVSGTIKKRVYRIIKLNKTGVLMSLINPLLFRKPITQFFHNNNLNLDHFEVPFRPSVKIVKKSDRVRSTIKLRKDRD